MSLSEDDYNGLAELLNRHKDKKVFVHCAANVKASNLIHIYQVVEMGVPEEESHLDLIKNHYPDELWYDYFRLFGLKGRV